ncbi:kinesin-like protein KIN-14B isoform X1 [Musa acuminata AAA Group]|uniref:kinesin-like protein KIN-14B isoform X1 n=2 Tax=Musa acuminata AAA Group TaxID=214697 RepID=UPI0031DB5BE4
MDEPEGVEPICCIIKDLQSSNLKGDLQVKSKMFEKMNRDCDESNNNLCVSKIQDALASLTVQLKELSIRRRQALNDFLDLKGNIRVFCRVRPFLPDEICGYARRVLTSDTTKLFLRIADDKNKQYSFDKVFHPQSTQEEVFSEIEPVIKSALDGYNVCIFAYGQTGTGKTYSMEGVPSNLGLVPRGIRAIFEQALESNYTFQFTFSMLEIYMGTLRDLLVPQSTKQRVHKACLSIQMNSLGGIEIENLVSIKVSNFEQVKRLYNLGSRSRSTASTKSNLKSSRSHCLTCISLTCSAAPERQKETNKIWMVDLGGSERLLKTQATGRRLEEGKAINLSLSALGDVISALQHKKNHVPYRNSKLTQVLRDSLGSDSKTLMFVHVSPKEEDLCETICSLGFATRVRSIHLESEKSPELQAKKEVEMAKLQQTITELESEQKDVQREIGRLNERLTLLTGFDQSNDVHAKGSLTVTGDLHFNGEVDLHNAKGFKRTSPSLPRFMKPTICSKQKTGSVHLSSTGTRKKSSIPSKMKRSASVYAESITSQAKDTACLSDYGSDFSMSTGYAIQGHGADDDTECSQGTSEYEIKQVIFPEQEKSPRSSMTSLHDGCFNNGSMKVKEINKNKHFTEDWLHLQTTGQTRTHNVGGKRIFAIPVDKRNIMCKQQNRVIYCNQAEIQNFRKRNSGSTKKTNLNGVDSLKSIVLDEARRFIVCSLTDMEDTQLDQNQDHDQVAAERTGGQVQEDLTVVTVLTETSGFRENPISVDSYNEDCSRPEQQENKEGSCMLFRTPRRSLFATHSLQPDQHTDLKESMIHITSCHDEEHGTNGLFLKTIQRLWASVLLGLGIQSLGLGCDFFHGLLH